MSSVMGPVRVLKFGGSSFIGLDDYAKIAKMIASTLSSQDGKIVIVVSGMSGSTGRLLQAALSIDPHLRPQVQDQVLATAEMVSASFMRAALDAAGCRAVDLWAHQLGIRTDSTASDARIAHVDPGPVRKALATHEVVVVAGGQAVDPDNRITMLGRNSSDLTATALAAALSATHCEIFGDTPGIFTADPHIVPAARPLRSLTYEQCIAMSESGAKVLHWGAVRHARRHRVVVHCRQTDPAIALDATPGTLVGAGPGETVVVGDSHASLYRWPPAAGSAAAAVRALRDANLVAHTVEHDGGTLLVFPGRQRVDPSLVGLHPKRVEGFGMLSVVEADGTTARRLVPAGDLDHAVVSEHDRIHGATGSVTHRRTGPKRRSAHSGLLLGEETSRVADSRTHPVARQGQP